MNVCNRFTSWFAVNALAAGLSIGVGAGTVDGAVININDYSLVPNGLNETTTFQSTDLSPDLLNPAVNNTVFYVVSTFTFGTASDAHLQWAFSTVNTSANRLGIEVQDTGLVQFLGTGDTTRTSFNFAQDMAGQTVVLLAKVSYNSNNNVTYGKANASDDTIMNVWINPNGADVEGGANDLSAGDISTIWNSTSFNWFRQTIQNQNTPGTSGTSTIGDTTILTGADATFANAMALVPVPEPGTWAILGAGAAVAGLRLARRRSNVKA
jgi:hypothetical protein